jgi:hypothetical protein
LDLAGLLDFYGWDLDLYWVEPKTGIILLLDGSSLSSVDFHLSLNKTLTPKQVLNLLKQKSKIAGRAKPVASLLSLKELKAQGRAHLKKLTYKRMKFWRKYVLPYYEESPMQLAEAA